MAPPASTLAALVALTILPWWPGGDSRWSSEPAYPHRVVVIDTVDGNAWYRHNLDDAIREWNTCHADIRLVIGTREPYSPGTITIFVDRLEDPQAAPYGGWNGEAGIAAVAGGWTRTRAVLAHEIGHALGFGHAGPNVDSIMDGLQYVTALDCQGLRHYY